MIASTSFGTDSEQAESSAQADRAKLPHGAGADWQRRSLAAVWHPCTQMQRASAVPPLAIASGEGPWLIDHDGRRYFDAISSWWTNLFGHSDARIRASIVDQLDRLPHVMLAGCTHAPAVELAERLSALTGNMLGHAFYASDGASAVEIALKMSFHCWRNRGRHDKREFVCLRQGYHGETLGALAVTDVKVFRDAYAPLLMQAHMVASPDARQALAGEDASDPARRAADELRTLLATRGAHIAAVIVEPLVQCAGGMAMHDPGYLLAVRRLCDEFEVHLIADEIAVGCGRTGSFFAFEQASASAVDGAPAKVWPDFICLSKGITGGTLPLSLVLTRDEIYASFLDDDVARGFLHSHSYTGNPLACRAALAVLDHFAGDDVNASNLAQAAALTAALAPLAHDTRIEHFRQRGMIWAFDVREDLLPERFAERLHLAGRARELLIRPIGRTVYLMPPYLLDPSRAAWLAERTADTLDHVLRGSPAPDADSAPEPQTA